MPLDLRELIHTKRLTLKSHQAQLLIYNLQGIFRFIPGVFRLLAS